MPVSATRQWINLVGLGSLGAAIGLALALRLQPFLAAFACLVAYAVPLALLEIGVEKVHRRASTGLDWSLPARRPADPARVRVKLAGLAGSLAAVVAAHWLIRFYDPAHMLMAGFAGLLVAPVFLLALLPYFSLVDRAMADPKDGYWHAGCFLLGRHGEVDWQKLRAHALGWTIKGFFLPIMFVYLVGALDRLEAVSFAEAGFADIVRWLTDYTIAFELTVVCVGYTCTFRLFDAHIRSPNPFLGAWLVTLVCYHPFNTVVTGQLFRYDDGTYWYDWFGGIPALAIPWGVAIVASFAVWVWATSSFGLRWSNLTHRGIITGGPYRFTKHPDYIAKSVFFWLVNVPFLSLAGPAEALRTSLMLVVVNLIYFGRAKMEERHLMQDPVYRAYAAEIAGHGLFASLGRRGKRAEPAGAGARTG